MTTSPPSAPAVRAEALTRSFGDTVAVAGVSIDVPEGAILGILGPDGAGKTTFIRMLATVLRPTSGDAAVFGRSVRDDPDAVTPRIGYMSQRFCMYPDLTVAENLDFFGTVRGVSRADRRARGERLLRGMGLDGFTGRQAQFLSGGMKQKLMLASTLMHEPDLLLLDEPTTGVDPVSRREFWAILGELHGQGKTVIVATPYMDEAERCTDLAFVDAGRITRSGTPEEITGQVPGTLFEVGDDEATGARVGVGSTTPRRVLAALDGHPAARAAHLHGDVARILWVSTGENAQREIDAVLRDRVPGTVARRAEVDMETAFALLAGADPAGSAA